MFTSCVVTGGMHDEKKGTREKRQMLMWACRLRIRLACRWGIIYVRGRALIKKKIDRKPHTWCSFCTSGMMNTYDACNYNSLCTYLNWLWSLVLVKTLKHCLIKIELINVYPVVQGDAFQSLLCSSRATNATLWIRPVRKRNRIERRETDSRRWQYLEVNDCIWHFRHRSTSGINQDGI